MIDVVSAALDTVITRAHAARLTEVIADPSHRLSFATRRALLLALGPQQLDRKVERRDAQRELDSSALPTTVHVVLSCYAGSAYPTLAVHDRAGCPDVAPKLQQIVRGLQREAGIGLRSSVT